MTKLHRTLPLVVVLGLTTACVQRNFSDSKQNSDRDAVPSLPASLGEPLGGRFLGIPEKDKAEALGIKSKHVGLLMEPLPDRSGSLAIVIYRTNILTDGLASNVKEGVSRVVDRVSIYKAQPRAGVPGEHEFLPLTLVDGALSEAPLTEGRPLSVLKITQANGGGGGILGKRSSYTASLTSAPAPGGAGEPVGITFDTFLENAKLPSSTWDKEFIADSWEDVYLSFLQKKPGRTARTTKDGAAQKLEVIEPESYKGTYVAAEVVYKNPKTGESAKIPGLYVASNSGADTGASNPLGGRLAIFIDVVNRKPVFATRELFLLDPAGNGPSYSGGADKGFVMYFQRNQDDE